MSKSNSPTNRPEQYVRSADESLRSVNRVVDNPHSVYRLILSAHKSLCAALNSANHSTDEGLNEETEIDSIRENIEQLEEFVSLLAADRQVLLGLFSDSTDSANTLSESDFVQLEDFLKDAYEVLPVGNGEQLNGEPLDDFIAHVEAKLKKDSTRDVSKGELLAHVEQLAEQLQRVPSHEDVRHSGRYPLTEYYNQFDSWTDVIEETKIDHRTAFLDDIRTVGDKIGKPPTIAGYNAYGEYSASRIKRTFGTWPDALDEAEIDLPTDEELCEEIETLTEKLDRIPTAPQMDEQGRFGSHRYIDRFGSWMAAVDTTGLDHRTEVIADLRDVATALGHFPTTTELEQYGAYSPHDVYKHFDTWEEVKDSIGTLEVDTEATSEKKKMIASLEKLAADLGRIPNGSHMNVQGEFDQYEITAEFGCWYNAIKATGLDVERSFIEDVRKVAKELEAPPTIVDYSKHGKYGTNDVYRYFESWPTLRDKAGVSTQAEVDTLGSQTTHSQNDSTPPSVPPSELAERYDAFLQLSRAVHCIVEYTGSTETQSPFFQWRELLSRFLSSGLEGWENGYGPQQGEGSPFSIDDYRETYGDGERVIDFQVIQTASVDPLIGALFESIDGLDIDGKFHLPIAPVTRTPLPILVETEAELDLAREKLAEFPEKPQVDQWEWSAPRERESAESDSENDTPGTNTSSGAAIEELCTVAGIEEAEAELLSAAGIETIPDLQHATTEELVGIDGITDGLAFRIKADVGGV